ncbi:MAG: hypothetical protein JWM28_2443 [Chitinophagaceae bacterium]|nr:hypothetical protein [Chitinophagaceae bacterium]
MKRIFLLVIWITIIFVSCKAKKGVPDVSGIKVDLPVQRFDKDFFAIDSNAMTTVLPLLQNKYPEFLPIFINNILGLGPLRPDNAAAYEGAKHFLHLTKPIYDSVAAVFPTADGMQRDFEEAFRYVKKYFPTYKAPDKIITLVGPIDGLAKMGTEVTPNFIGAGFLGISLQFYLGKDYSAYNDEYFIINVAPQYRSRRFEKQYIVPDAMKLIVDDLFPDNTQGRPLIEQLVEKGKQWWLLDQFLPEAADSLKTGYTQKQLEWCKVNEGLIWNYIVTNENIYTVDPVSIQQYIGEAPFTQNMSDASPGNIGAWVGWQIVKKYAENNSAISPEGVMNSDVKKILEGARYKPK